MSFWDPKKLAEQAKKRDEERRLKVRAERKAKIAKLKLLKRKKRLAAEEEERKKAEGDPEQNENAEETKKEWTPPPLNRGFGFASTPVPAINKNAAQQNSHAGKPAQGNNAQGQKPKKGNDPEGRDGSGGAGGGYSGPPLPRPY